MWIANRKKSLIKLNQMLSRIHNATLKFDGTYGYLLSVEEFDKLREIKEFMKDISSKYEKQEKETR